MNDIDAIVASLLSGWAVIAIAIPNLLKSPR
jgi:hypothetical protein